MKDYQGGCHCGAFRFQVSLPDSIEVEDCNCSVCKKAGYLHVIIPSKQFKVLKGQDKMQLYTFNSGVAKHYFCKTCGVKPYYIPRSNPDGVDVNLRCLDAQPPHVEIVAFDGENWEQNAHKLAHKSKA